MADKKELRKHILRAYCAVNDAIAVGQDGVEHGGKDIGLAALLMIARNALHWALDTVDFERKGRIASEPAGPHFQFRPATVWKPPSDPTPEESDVLEVVEGVVRQACTMDDGTLDSMALTYYRDAIKLLAQAGRVEIVSEAGRRIIARWPTKDSQPPKGPTWIPVDAPEAPVPDPLGKFWRKLAACFKRKPKKGD